MKDYTLTLITPPGSEPISISEAAGYMRVDTSDDAAYIQDIIKAAREYCEAFQRRAYITQTWELSLQEFPNGYNDRLNDCQGSNIIELPKGSLQTVDSFTYTDYAGTIRTMTQNVNYILSTRGVLGKLAPPYAVIWPPDPLFPLDPIVIKFTCGYGEPEDVPMKVKQAMYMLINYWYDNRPPSANSIPVELERALTALLSLERIAVGS